ncbi:MAG: hypothetical protein WC926_01080 [Candidatus Paceibacterota bacterium]|jgi:hypothetical protein
MEKIIHKNTIFAGLSLFSVLFAILVLVGIVSLPNFAEAEDVTVSATIDEWISFSVDDTTLDLGTLVNSSGALTLGAASTSLTLGSNSADGFSVSVSGTNAGLKNGTAHTIATPAAGATTTCDISGDGTDAYGLQATSTTMTAQDIYNYGSNIVGSVAVSSQKVLSVGASAVSNSAILTVRASANKYDANGSYTDTLVVTAAANP